MNVFFGRKIFWGVPVAHALRSLTVGLFEVAPCGFSRVFLYTVTRDRLRASPIPNAFCAFAPTKKTHRNCCAFFISRKVFQLFSCRLNSWRGFFIYVFTQLEKFSIRCFRKPKTKSQSSFVVRLAPMFFIRLMPSSMSFTIIIGWSVASSASRQSAPSMSTTFLRIVIACIGM